MWFPVHVSGLRFGSLGLLEVSARGVGSQAAGCRVY